MITTIKNYKTVIISILTTIFISTFVTIITLYTDNDIEKKTLSNHSLRIEALEKNDLAQQKQLNKNELSTLNIENMLLKNQNNEEKNRDKIDRIDQNMFELLKIIKRK